MKAFELRERTSKELKDKIDSVVDMYNKKTNNDTLFYVVQLMNEINDMIEEHGAFYTIDGAEKPLIYYLFYLNSNLKWNKLQKHKISLLKTYFNEEIYKSSMNQNFFNFLPKTKNSNIDKIKIKSYDSSDKSFRDLVSDFCGKDGLRPNIQMTNFNSLGIVSTDAHKMLFISKKNENQKEENKCISDFCLKNQEKFPLSYENTKFPNWKAIIPQKYVVPFDFVFNTEDLLKYLQICLNFGFFYKNETTNSLIVTLRFQYENDYKFYAFNLFFLLECLEALLKLGIKKAKIHYGENNRVIVFTNENNNSDFLDGDCILLSPVNFGSELMNFYFDLKENSVVYADKKYEFPLLIEDSIKEQPIQIKEEPIQIEKKAEKKIPENPNEKKSISEQEIDTSDMNFAQIVYNSNPNKFKKFKDLEWFKLKPNQTLVIIFNKDENKIVYEKIHNNLKRFNLLTDRLLNDPNIRKNLGDSTSFFYFDFDSLKKSNNINYGSEYDYFNAKGLVEEIKDFFEAKKYKEQQILKKKFPEDKRLIKGNEYYLWTETRGDSSNPKNFIKYKYKGLVHNVNKYAYGSENIYQFSTEYTTTSIPYEKLENAFINTEIYSVEDFEKWEKEYQEKYNPAPKKEETPTESKSDLEYLNELLVTSNDLLDLIFETGSEADINFLKEKIEATKDLISLLQ